MCFEKCYRPFLLFSKKRYVGLAHDDDGGARIDCKGVQFVRRDTCAFVCGECCFAARIIFFFPPLICLENSHKKISAGRAVLAAYQCKY
jgi:hypothetical protein